MQKPYWQRGFTLPEMLVTLAILSVLLLLVIPLSMERLHAQQEKQVLDLLQSDLLYAQVVASANPKKQVNMTISQERNQYTVSKGPTEILKRSIPENWIDDTQKIIFKRNGVVRQPASFVIRTPRRSLKITFPFGKGRAYIAEI